MPSPFPASTTLFGWSEEQICSLSWTIDLFHTGMLEPSNRDYIIRVKQITFVTCNPIIPTQKCNWLCMNYEDNPKPRQSIYNNLNSWITTWISKQYNSWHKIITCFTISV
jgi:hypothetical protein